MSGSTSSGPVSELLVRWRGGDNEALGSLIPLVYAELRKLAHGYLRRERADHTLQSAQRLCMKPMFGWLASRLRTCKIVAISLRLQPG
jgi:hypothetical protein